MSTRQGKQWMESTRYWQRSSTNAHPSRVVLAPVDLMLQPEGSRLSRAVQMHATFCAVVFIAGMAYPELELLRYVVHASPAIAQYSALCTAECRVL